MLGPVIAITRSASPQVSISLRQVIPFAAHSTTLYAPRFASTMAEGLSTNCWNQHKQTIEYPALKTDLQTDVCIVGAGIAGLTTAYKLAAAGEIKAAADKKWSDPFQLAEGR